ncbi:MAG: hypothetical protein A3C82_01285 [Candidatus Wildermuthbacteria bacterium RIFCSPHIGHO2_02_FULL_47_12]|uniref:D-isomer specific 2-hydroxyacid dehydrogenase NAD-binding domain-containing protein n=2 Tax=Parcubacteria group TaxID=1794811 RepID=A0A1G2R2C8_9BACT|nr:MAG: hypothetical protein A3A24_03570 [Candidatus Buchananbacteria bacterium RIFCSPLOWO2_01_FULL_46_12]OHA66738.1 MAG: hypothetical protein A3C82_01285 [Candidatus Wildermuthbacteria bacterium RIFCSPHIGHO2_02_FULL_47_12]
MKTQERPQVRVSSVERGRDQQPPRTKRFLLWCLANFVIWPTLGLVAKRLRLFQFLFVVYPGTQNNIRAYAPMWFQKIFKGMFQLSVIGIMTRRTKTGKRGLIVTLSEAPDNFSREELQTISERIRGLGKKAGVSTIALAGRLPTLFSANGIPLERPFVKGDRGAVFTITETFLYLLKLTGVAQDEPVGIIGLGYLGSRVAKRLQELECPSIVGYDVRVKENGIYGSLVRTNDPKLLQSCRIVIVLTPKGEDIAKIVPWLQNGVFVIDDTHPQIPPSLIQKIQEKGGTVYRSTLGVSGVRARPRLPGYHKNWLPGCVVEALVLNGEVNGLTPAEFEQRGREIGLAPFLVSPRGEG